MITNVLQIFFCDEPIYMQSVCLGHNKQPYGSAYNAEEDRTTLLCVGPFMEATCTNQQSTCHVNASFLVITLRYAYSDVMCVCFRDGRMNIYLHKIRQTDPPLAELRQNAPSKVSRLLESGVAHTVELPPSRPPLHAYSEYILLILRKYNNTKLWVFLAPNENSETRREKRRLNITDKHTGMCHKTWTCSTNNVDGRMHRN
ncbi:unnamed protein product [Ectocarpus fasciculatus]